MNSVEEVRFDFAGLHNQALDLLGHTILNLYGVRGVKPKATGTQVETATGLTTTETRPPDVEKPS